MKKPILLFTFFLLAFSGFSQKKQKTLGIVVAPGLHYDLLNEQFNFGYGAGFYYDHQLSRRFGLNTGLQLRTERYKYIFSSFCRDCEGIRPEKVITRNSILEVPLNLTFNLNPRGTSGFKTYLFSGITLTRVVATKGTWYYPSPYGVKTERMLDHRHNLYGDSYMNLGFEMRRNLNEKFGFAFGLGAKFRPAYGFNFDPHANEPILYNLNLKFGRIL